MHDLIYAFTRLSYEKAQTATTLLTKFLQFPIIKGATGTFILGNKQLFEQNILLYNSKKERKIADTNDYATRGEDINEAIYKDRGIQNENGN